MELKVVFYCIEIYFKNHAFKHVKVICSKAIANNEDTQGSLSKATVNNEYVNNKEKTNKHSLIVKDEKNPKSKRKIT